MESFSSEILKVSNQGSTTKTAEKQKKNPSVNHIMFLNELKML